MPDDRSPVPASALPSPMATGLTRAEFDALARELRDAYGMVEPVTARPGAEAT